MGLCLYNGRAIETGAPAFESDCSFAVSYVPNFKNETRIADYLYEAWTQAGARNQDWVTSMLFYVKKWIILDLLVTIALACAGYFGIHFLGLPVHVEWNAITALYSFLAFIVITAWTFLVQMGYSWIKGSHFAKKLTLSLAQHYAHASIAQALFGAVTASLGEELFFRGFIQMKWGLLAGAVAFGIAHWGPKDIRTVSYWSFLHGLLFGLAYQLTGNLAVPMISHGVFDFAAMLYFRRFVAKQAPAI